MKIKKWPIFKKSLEKLWNNWLSWFECKSCCTPCCFPDWSWWNSGWQTGHLMKHPRVASFKTQDVLIWRQSFTRSGTSAIWSGALQTWSMSTKPSLPTSTNLWPSWRRRASRSEWTQAKQRHWFWCPRFCEKKTSKLAKLCPERFILVFTFEI